MVALGKGAGSEKVIDSHPVTRWLFLSRPDYYAAGGLTLSCRSIIIVEYRLKRVCPFLSICTRPRTPKDLGRCAGIMRH